MNNVYKLEGINFGENDIITLNVTIDNTAIEALKIVSHDDIHDLETPDKDLITDILFELEEQLAENSNFKDTLSIAYENPEYMNSYKQLTLNYEIIQGLFKNNYECFISVA